MELTLRPVNPASIADLAYLYAVLSRRLDEKGTNISHQALPTFEDHCTFVRGQPYAGHYVTVDKGLNVGAAYVTKDHEIGLWVAPEHRREGIGAWTLRALMRLHRNDRWLANVNADNTASGAFFLRHGFVPRVSRTVGRGVKMITYIRNKTVAAA